MNNIFTATFLVLLVLKLTGLAAISWWIVWLPIFVSLPLILLIALAKAAAKEVTA